MLAPTAAEAASLLDSVMRQAMLGAVGSDREPGCGALVPTSRWMPTSHGPPVIARSVAVESPRVVGSLHMAEGRTRLDHLWWGQTLEGRAQALAAIFAIDLLVLVVSEHVLAMAIVTRPDRAMTWSDREVLDRLGRVRQSRNLFAHAGMPFARGTPKSSAELKRAGQLGRARLSCDVAFRRELIRWAWHRRSVVRPAPERFGRATVRASSNRLDDPSLVAAIGIVGLECSALRARWLGSAGGSGLGQGTRDPLLSRGMSLTDLSASARLRDLTGELRRAATTTLDERPITRGIRSLIGQERFDHMQRSAVEAVDAWEEGRSR
jgi:hypothetical protein